MARYDIPEGEYETGGARFAIVVAKFNGPITERLLEGAQATLGKHGVNDEAIDIVRVPGAFELPLAARRAASGDRVAAVIALGAVVRGGTPHFEYVCRECARGIMQVGLELDLPVIFGVLTTDTMEQALARAGGAEGNKGRAAAIAALEMTTVLRAFGE